MPTWEARYALALFDGGSFVGFVPGARLDPVQMPAEARKFSLPADARLAAAELAYPASPRRVEPWDLLLQRPLGPEG